ncbi:hypothetical protein BT69DRAFT_1276403 [Atractiella rhizophila]|nr:hypothetical protein BT69DRAFT_1276403 [Atractiella rhizophila]
MQAREEPHPESPPLTPTVSRLHRADLSGVAELAKENQRHMRRSETMNSRFSSVVAVASPIARLFAMPKGRESAASLPAPEPLSPNPISKPQPSEESRRLKKLETKLSEMEESYKRMEASLEKIVQVLTRHESFDDPPTDPSPESSGFGLTFETTKLKPNPGKTMRRKT